MTNSDEAIEPTSCTPAELIARLNELGLVTNTVEHEAVFTVAQAKELEQRGDGGHIKNLFLRNKKGRMWLITFSEDRILDLKALAETLGAKRFSFASKERLMTYLGVVPGAVTPFGLINDHQRAVCLVLDAKLLDYDLMYCHPLVNTMTTAIAPHDLLTFVRAVHDEPTVLDLDKFLLSET